MPWTIAAADPESATVAQDRHPGQGISNTGYAVTQAGYVVRLAMRRRLYRHRLAAVSAIRTRHFLELVYGLAWARLNPVGCRAAGSERGFG